MLITKLLFFDFSKLGINPNAKDPRQPRRSSEFLGFHPVNIEMPGRSPPPFHANSSASLRCRNSERCRG
jgi:hypothetical protein